jgi:hypothetical protein
MLLVVEHNAGEEMSLVRAKCSKNLILVTWNAIAHSQPLSKSVEDEAIKHYSFARSYQKVLLASLVVSFAELRKCFNRFAL